MKKFINFVNKVVIWYKANKDTLHVLYLLGMAIFGTLFSLQASHVISV